VVVINRIKRENKAIAYQQQYHDIIEEIGDWLGVADFLHNIGEVFIKLENYSEAETKIQESLVISQEINIKDLIAKSLKALASTVARLPANCTEKF
jgi:hypothetical protein